VQRTQQFGASQLAEIQAEIVGGGRAFGVAFEGFAAGGDPLDRERGTLGIVGGKLAPVEGGAGELPGGNVIGRFRLVKSLRRHENGLRMAEQPNPLGGVGIRSHKRVR
jgi:hypothetical protein